MGAFILINEKFHPSGERLFQYSDLGTILFEETFRVVRSNLAFFSETCDLVRLKLRIYNQAEPEILAHDGAGLKRQIERLLVKNKLFKGAVVRLVFWESEGTLNYMLSIESTDFPNYELNTKGLLVDVFDKAEKAVCSLSNLSLGSDALWQIAQRHCVGSACDDFLLMNTSHQIIEAIRKNIYLVHGSQLLFASPASGAYVDVSHEAVIRIAEKIKLVPTEKAGFTIDHIYSSDEIFLANSLVGIQWVVGFREKRYYNMKTKHISEELSGMLNDEV